MNYEPERDLEMRFPHVQVELADLSPALAAVIPGESLILFSRELTPTQRRTSLAHEIAHLDLHHSPTPLQWFSRRQEAEADTLAVRRLITVAALADLVGWCATDAELAQQLQVSIHAIRLRRTTLSQAESAIVEARIACVEYAA